MSSKTEQQLRGEKLLRELREQLERYEELETECERLKGRVGLLEREREELRRSLEVLRAERDDCLRSLYAYVKSEITEEELRRYDQEAPGTPLLDFVEQLEKMKGQ